jgi:hypothetical protein
MNDLANPATARSFIHRRWNENGLEELILGLFASTIGSIYLTDLFARVPWLPLLVCALGMSYARWKLSAKMIFPRTGYVVWRPSETRLRVLWALVGVLLLIAGILAFWGSSLPDMSRGMGPMVALIFTACFVWGAVEYKIGHFIWFAVIALGMGFVTYFADAKIAGSMWVLLAIGIPMAFSGALQMRRFVRTHPVIEDRHD